MAVKEHTSFEQYLATREPGPKHEGGPCTSCMEREPVTSDGYCRECLRYLFGGDETEGQLVDAIIGGAVTAALDATVPSELIVVAVHRAIKKHRDEAEDAAIKFLEATKGMS